MENKYLNEEKYNKTKNKLSFISLLIFIIGLLLGGFVISIGIKYNNENSIKSKEQLEKEIIKYENTLKIKKEELKSKGIIYSQLANYEDEEAYDLKIITNALDPSFDYCSFDEYKNNSITKEYCLMKNDFNSNISFNKSIPYFIGGGFIIIVSLMFSSFIYMITKRRQILAFSAQQVMPIAKEGLEEMAPTVGKVGKEIAKEMAPVYGEIAKEITKGIKEGKK